MMNMQTANMILRQMEQTARPCASSLSDFTPPYKVGVDLGTSNIVITVLDNNNTPMAYALQSASVVRDGIVVEFLNAINILKALKLQLEERLETPLVQAATAIPPGILSGNSKVIKNVVEGAGFEVVAVIDEPEAAALTLGICDGAVIDMGGGTTGVSVVRGGKVAFSVDEPTGGTHMTLVVAGHLKIGFAEAEAYKVKAENYTQVFNLIHPVAEKMASITKSAVKNEDIKVLYLAGGTSCLRGIENVFEKYTRIPTRKPENPLLVTPIGIAMSIRSIGG